ncbi:hypothetical protein E4P42_02540 [Mycobacterium sp. PS03-16]|uniref:LpqN/LpqT family lipoprotein n=1 Tax=Mycobacterium sp. PS03-16 TaxID=2559611 RepID=UPI001073D6A2|nr:LpqN/LpqT family lipoprotein [Mycobacterium sp. PS03-16]TFV61071.1 hypothetical protein E4P42_02540 [Mycobacterium sp. PS03-16]
MARSLRAGGVTALALALAITLAGCGSDSESAPAAEETTSSSAAETSTSAPAAEPDSPQAAEKNHTIVDYIRDNGIQETPVKPGDPGAPTIELPPPPGWADAGDRAPAWAYTAFLFTDPAMAQDPPTIIALMSKLTGDVDPAKILEFAPGEIKNLPGYQNLGDGEQTQMSGFDAVQIGGAYTRDGVTRMIAQKTVVIPGADGLYVLQINADGLEDQIGPLMDATANIDETIRITV